MCGARGSVVKLSGGANGVHAVFASDFRPAQLHGAVMRHALALLLLMRHAQAV